MKPWPFILALALASMGTADVRYVVTPAQTRDKVAIEMDFDVAGPVDLQLPSWSPGLYVLENYWKTMGDVTAFDGAGRSLNVTHPRSDTWHVDPAGAKRIKVRYDRPIAQTRERLGMFSSDDKTVHFSGPWIYLYVVGRKTDPCSAEFKMPIGWKIAIGLLPTRKGGRVFRARSYDQLADNPVTMGDFLEDHYSVRGKDVEITYRGDAAQDVDRAKTIKMCRFVTEAETDFFGGAPFDKYVWQFWVTKRADGAGGVEHASSTQMFLSTGEGPGALAGMAHESFHLWNVKRIRSKPLGPFDYTAIPKTGALWWLEGVTDYYAAMMPHRYGWWGDSKYLRDVAMNIESVRENPARMDVSPYESSYRISEDTGGMSSGYKVSYYPTGWVLGMMFDIELRARSDGKRSLDDVELALWGKFKRDGSGFEEDELRKLLIRYGGTHMGSLYDAWVMQPGDLPVENELAKVGLQLVRKQEGILERLQITDLPNVSPAQLKLREGWYFGRKSRPKTLIDPQI